MSCASGEALLGVPLTGIGAEKHRVSRRVYGTMCDNMAEHTTDIWPEVSYHACDMHLRQQVC